MASVCTEAFARCCHGNCSREDRCRSDEAKDWIPSNTLLYRKAFPGVSLLRKGPSWFSCALNDKGVTDSNPIPRPPPSTPLLLLDNLSAATQYKDDSSKFPAAPFPRRCRPAICMPTNSGRQSGRRLTVNLENDVFERAPVRSHLPWVDRQFSPIRAQTHWTGFNVAAQIDRLHLSILAQANCDIRWTYSVAEHFVMLYTGAVQMPTY